MKTLLTILLTVSALMAGNLNPHKVSDSLYGAVKASGFKQACPVDLFLFEALEVVYDSFPGLLTISDKGVYEINGQKLPKTGFLTYVLSDSFTSNDTNMAFSTLYSATLTKNICSYALLKGSVQEADRIAGALKLDNLSEYKIARYNLENELKAGINE